MISFWRHLVFLTEGWESEREEGEQRGLCPNANIFKCARLQRHHCNRIAFWHSPRCVSHLG